MGVCQGSFGELVGTGKGVWEFGSLGVWAVLCFMFAWVQRTMPNAGGAWPCAELPVSLCHHVHFYYSSHSQPDMLVRVDELAILLVISTLASKYYYLLCAIPFGHMLMVGWYLCWGPELARIVVGTL